ncbi:MAG: GHKL domain-containing protein [Chlorobi bacterium]|nr:GHKL domain-containing protein [Chlorobiota bacterium]
MIEEKNIRIDIKCSENLEADINAILLERALVNLIDNAVKYSDKNGRVLISVTKETNCIVFTIKDWGSGIPSEHHARLFERFYRVDKGRSRELGGTGLGLSIVKHIAFAHNGKVTVKSEPGKGSEFAVIIPSN